MMPIWCLQRCWWLYCWLTHVYMLLTYYVYVCVCVFVLPTLMWHRQTTRVQRPVTLSWPRANQSFDYPLYISVSVSANNMFTLYLTYYSRYLCPVALTWTETETLIYICIENEKITNKTHVLLTQRYMSLTLDSCRWHTVSVADTRYMPLTQATYLWHKIQMTQDTCHWLKIHATD